MGKPTLKKKIQAGSNGNAKQSKGSDRNSKALDEETAVVINMSQELKEEGNKLFQKRDHEGAMLKYEKALKLLPTNHIDIAYLRTNMAACYMELGIGEYPRAINQCNLALQVAPKYSKALLKRARCYEALNRLDLALRDVNNVLTMEPNNLTALEIADRVKNGIEKMGMPVEDKEVVSPQNDNIKPTYTPVSNKVVRKKGNKRKSKTVVEKKAEDKVIVSVLEEKVVMKSVKLVHGEDIRWAQLPLNCNVHLVRDIVIDRFPNLKGVLIKYKDEEGDLVTVTTTNELRIAEGLADPQGFLRLYITEVSPDKEPLYDGKVIQELVVHKSNEKPMMVVENGTNEDKGPFCVEDWIYHFARLFKNHVGFDLDHHEIGSKLYSEAIEDTVTTEDAQRLFEIAGSNFHEMTALALFNWGNVHLSKARKRVGPSVESLSTTNVKDSYEWAHKEYAKAGSRYEESVRIKPDFYEGFLALSQQQFEQAKLSWYTKMGSSAEVLELYNKAEDSMEKGMQIWEEIEEKRLNGPTKHEKDKRDVSAGNIRSRVYLLWGTMLYERSVVEYKLSLPTWEECLEVAVEKFELGGALPNDIAVMIKNHCSNGTALEGFKVDEIIQAQNEMYDADRWRTAAASFRLEPLFSRRSSKLHSVLEHL